MQLDWFVNRSEFYHFEIYMTCWGWLSQKISNFEQKFHLFIYIQFFHVITAPKTLKGSRNIQGWYEQSGYQLTRSTTQPRFFLIQSVRSDISSTTNGILTILNFSQRFWLFSHRLKWFCLNQSLIMTITSPNCVFCELKADYATRMLLLFFFCSP